jgi:hypothetical protein
MGVQVIPDQDDDPIAFSISEGGPGAGQRPATEPTIQRDGDRQHAPLTRTVAVLAARTLLLTKLSNPM